MAVNHRDNVHGYQFDTQVKNPTEKDRTKNLFSKIQIKTKRQICLLESPVLS